MSVFPQDKLEKPKAIALPDPTVHNIHGSAWLAAKLCIPRLAASIQLFVRATSGFNIPAGWALTDAVSRLEPLEAFNIPVPDQAHARAFNARQRRHSELKASHRGYCYRSVQFGELFSPP